MKTTSHINRFASSGTLRAALGLVLWWLYAGNDALAFPPQITTQPTNQTIQVGGTAIFAVQASSGTTLTYQWYFQSNAIAGATNSIYTRTNAQLTNAGKYYVGVTNADGGLLSSNAMLTVVTYPVIKVDNNSSARTNSRTLNWSHTVSTGNGRLLLVAIATGSSTTTASDATTVTNVTYGGTALTPVGTVAELGNRARTYIYQMVNPPSGTANVVVYQTAARPVCVGATTFTGVDPITPLGAYASNSVGTAPGIQGGVTDAQLAGITSGPGEIVFDVLGLDSDGATYSLAPGSGQTALWTQTTSTFFAGGSSIRAGAASAGTTWTWSAADAQQYALGAVSIKPSAYSDVITTVTGPASVFATTNFTYTISVTNLGTATASNIVVSDSLPAGSNVVSISGGGIVVGGGPGQVVFDSASSIVYSNIVGSTQTWTHITTNAANRLMLVGVSFGNLAGSSAVTALTYGGVSLTKLRALTNAVISSELWQLINPPSGTNTVSLAFVGTPTTLVAGAATFSGVDRAMPLSDTNSASGNSKSASVTVSSAANETVFDTLTSGKDKSKTPGASQTQLWSLRGAESGFASIQPGANFVTSSWTESQVFDWAQIAASVKAAGLIGVVSWTIPTLASGATTNFLITVTAPLSGTLSNLVSSTSTTPDANPANNDGSAAAARVLTTVLPIADLVTTLSGPISVATLTNYTYTVTVSNRGPSTASSVVVSNKLSPTITYISSTGSGTYLAGVVTWPAINLAKNATANFTVTVRSPLSGLLTNTAASTSVTADSNLANNNGSAPAAQVITVVSPLQVANTSKGAAVQTLNWSHTVAPGSSRILIVGVSIDSTTATVNAATFNNLLPLTLIGQTNGPQTKVLLYRLLNPPVGTFSVSINLNTAVGIVGGAVSLNGVNQVNPIAAFVGNSGTGSNASLTLTSALGSVVIDTIAPKSPQYATNPSPAQTIEWNLSGADYSGAGSSSYGAASVSPAWALDNAATWAMGAVALNPATILSDITLRATGPASVLATSNLTCTITVTNLGAASATNVVVSHVLPAEATFVSASPGGSNNNGVVSWPALTNFITGARTNYSVTIQAPATGTMTNIVYSTAFTADPDPSNNNGTGTGNQVVTTVAPLAEVATTVTGPASVLATADFSYTVTVTNAGPSPANDLVVSDPLPAGVTFLSASGDGTFNAGVVTWSLASLESGATTNFTLTVTAPVSGTLLNTVASTSTATDLVPSNNDGSAPAAQVLTTVAAVADLATTVTGPAIAITNVPFSYSVTVSNLGPSVATSVAVSNTLPAGVVFVSASSGGTANAGVVNWSLSSLLTATATNLTVTVFAPNIGSLTDTVASAAATGDPDGSNNDGTTVAAQVVTEVYPFLLLTGQALPSGRFQVEFHTYADTLVAMQASTNLVEWVTLITTNSGDGHVIFMDLDTTNHPTRFYRSRQGF